MRVVASGYMDGRRPLYTPHNGLVDPAPRTLVELVRDGGGLNLVVVGPPEYVPDASYTPVGLLPDAMVHVRTARGVASVGRVHVGVANFAAARERNPEGYGVGLLCFAFGARAIYFGRAELRLARNAGVLGAVWAEVWDPAEIAFASMQPIHLEPTTR